jgi:hypothetical protein
MINQSKEIQKLQQEVQNLQKEQSPAYHQNLESIEENFTQLSKFMKTHQNAGSKFGHSPAKNLLSKQTRRNKINN